MGGAELSCSSQEVLGVVEESQKAYLYNAAKHSSTWWYIVKSAPRRRVRGMPI
jgi:hypothetical protein